MMIRVPGEKPSVSNSFFVDEDEEDESRYSYNIHSVLDSAPSVLDYQPNRHLSVNEIIADFERQVRILDDLFNCGSRFDIDWLVQAHAVCPAWVEKFFAEVPWQKIASTYKGAVKIMLDTIVKTREFPFKNYCKSQPNSRFQRKKRTIRMRKRLSEMQKDHDIAVVPAQFGLRHRGRSDRRACAIFISREFGLSTHTVINMLLTHPERFTDDDSPSIYCSGDEYDDPDSPILFDRVPCFWCGVVDDSLRYGTRPIDYTAGYSGSVSGFVPYLK